LASAAFLGRWKQLRQQQITSESYYPLPDSSTAVKSAGRGFAGPTRDSSGSPGNLRAGEFKFSCPKCGQHIRCDQGYSGRQINCPACRHEIRVPEPIRRG